jgi:hypothetical protein
MTGSRGGVFEEGGFGIEVESEVGAGVVDGVRSRGVEGSEGAGRTRSSVVVVGMEDILLPRSSLLNFKKLKI